MDDIRITYLVAADTALALLMHENPASYWHEKSVLHGMTVGVLAGHLARSVLQVGWFLDGDVTGGLPPVTATTYYARLTDTASRTSPLNAGVEQRSAEAAVKGPRVIASEARDALDALRVRLPEEPADRRVAVAHRPGEELLLDEYLRTRLVEIAVHIEDLALSVELDHPAPPAAVAAAVDLLVDAARERHGDLAVFHALSRRERDNGHSLQVL